MSSWRLRISTLLSITMTPDDHSHQLPSSTGRSRSRCPTLEMSMLGLPMRNGTTCPCSRGRLSAPSHSMPSMKGDKHRRRLHHCAVTGAMTARARRRGVREQHSFSGQIAMEVKIKVAAAFL